MKLLFVLLAAPVLLWVLACGLLWAFQERLLFHPDPRPLGQPGPGFEEQTVTTADGLRLVFWAAPARPGMPTIVVFHGNAGNAADREPGFRPLVADGYGVALAEYRAYAGNPGTPSETGLLEDARAVMGWAAQRGGALVVWGESLGSGVAVAMAAERPVAAVVLDAPYTSVAAVAAGQFPWVPVGLLLRHPFDTLARLPGVRAPVLVLHGEADRLIPVAHGRRVVAALGERARGVFLPGVAHTAFGNDPLDRDLAAVRGFLAAAR